MKLENFLLRSEKYNEIQYKKNATLSSLSDSAYKALDSFVQGLGSLPSPQQRMLIAINEYKKDTFIGWVHRFLNTERQTEQLYCINRALRALEETPQNHLHNVENYADLVFHMHDFKTLSNQLRIYGELFIGELAKVLKDEVVERAEDCAKKIVDNGDFTPSEKADFYVTDILSKSKFFKNSSLNAALALRDFDINILKKTRNELNNTFAEFITISERLGTTESNKLIRKIMDNKDYYSKIDDGKYKELVDSLAKYLKSKAKVEKFKEIFFDFLNKFTTQDTINEVENNSVILMNALLNRKDL